MGVYFLTPTGIRGEVENRLQSWGQGWEMQYPPTSTHCHAYLKWKSGAGVRKLQIYFKRKKSLQRFFLRASLPNFSPNYQCKRVSHSVVKDSFYRLEIYCSYSSSKCNLNYFYRNNLQTKFNLLLN